MAADSVTIWLLSFITMVFFVSLRPFAKSHGEVRRQGWQAETRVEIGHIRIKRAHEVARVEPAGIITRASRSDILSLDGRFRNGPTPEHLQRARL